MAARARGAPAPLAAEAHMWIWTAIVAALFLALLGIVYFAVREHEQQMEREERAGPTPPA